MVIRQTRQEDRRTHRRTHADTQTHTEAGSAEDVDLFPLLESGEGRGEVVEVR